MNDNIIPDQLSEIDMLPLQKTGDLSETSTGELVYLPKLLKLLINDPK